LTELKRRTDVICYQSGHDSQCQWRQLRLAAAEVISIYRAAAAAVIIAVLVVDSGAAEQHRTRINVLCRRLSDEKDWLDGAMYRSPGVCVLLAFSLVQVSSMHLNTLSYHFYLLSLISHD